ncbi:rRNA methyltransferase 1, mitochondrial isoform X5 [Ictidomys tridecemlineatus]|uniref:rRNA methyltransferase 1, mitochondrial isoform X5 n=1 Tax=Ictidomys tridecemlineatus TaxID=43179 RepID=UPI001A9DED90|nr:rRNA methyltransferase 1, mitochondrial isoform X5 [Ictidomys tridecemlineatus]
MGLLSTLTVATGYCSGRLVARHFSRGVRPGGEELSRLRLDDLAPTPRLELLFGLSPCLLALRAARRRVARLLLQAGRAGLQGERAELLREAEARDIPVLRPRRQKLDALCRHQVHQGVCMEAKARQGWLVAGTVGCPGPEVSQSSQTPIMNCLEFLWDQPTLLVLGNEGSGLSQEVQASCRLLLTILPGRQLPPGLESLNVSVAAVQEFFFTPFAARGKVSVQWKRQRSPSKTHKDHQLCPKDCESLSTQNRLPNQKKRGKWGLRGLSTKCT